jgi:hypothetical protein
VRSADRDAVSVWLSCAARKARVLRSRLSRVYVSAVSLALRVGWLLPVSFLVLLAGCDSGSADGANAGSGGASEPVVVLGTGVEQYEPIEDEPALRLIKGFQGGFHVWASFLAYDFETIVLRMELITSRDGHAESIIPMQGNVRVREVMDAAGRPARALVGWPAVIYDAECAHGRRIRLDLLVRDEANGTEASDTRFFIAEVAEEERGTSCSL